MDPLKNLNAAVAKAGKLHNRTLDYRQYKRFIGMLLAASRRDKIYAASFAFIKAARNAKRDAVRNPPLKKGMARK